MGRKIGKSAIEVMRERFPANASEIETYADAFDVLAEKVKTGGGRLPSVTNTDNGKVLSVSSGAWAAVKTRLDVTFTVTVDETTGDVSGSANGTTFADVIAAFAAQKDLIAWIVLPSGAIMTTRSYVLDSVANPSSISFTAVADLSGYGETFTPTFYQITMVADSEELDVRVEPLTLANT